MAFKTRMVWRSVGAGHWDVELVQLIDGRAALLATLSLDEWIDLGATQYVFAKRCHDGRRSPCFCPPAFVPINCVRARQCLDASAHIRLASSPWTSSASNASVAIEPAATARRACWAGSGPT